MRSRSIWGALAGAIAGLLLLMAFFTGAHAGFTAAVKNTENKVGTGTAFLAAKQGATTLCSSVPAGSSVPATATFPCDATTMPDNLAAASGSKVTTFTHSGTQAFGGATMRVNSCSPEIFANDYTTGNPLVARNAISWSQAGPSRLSGSGSLAFNGTDTQGNGIAPQGALQTYSISVWFKTSVAQGAVFEATNSAYPGSASTYDRVLYFETNGSLSFGTYTGSIHKINTTANYADNAWHLAVATATAGNPNSSISLYIDNVAIGTTSFAATSTSQGGNNYWRVGRGFTSGGSWGGNGNFFKGNIADMVTYSVVLAPADVATLWSQTTQAGYISAARGLSANNIWDLIEDSTATIANSSSLTVPAANDPCNQINITVASSTECVYPAQATCPAVGSSSSILSFVGAGTKPLTPPAVGGSTTLTVNTAQNSSWTATANDGILLRTDVTLATQNFTQNFRWTL